MILGNQAGAVYPLSEEAENRIGRGQECGVAIVDPLCSRVHAVVRRDGDNWRFCDASSRNGSYIDGHRVEEASLEDNCQIRVGSTEFLFQLLPELLEASEDEPRLIQTIVREQPVAADIAEQELLGGFHDDQRMSELLVLYQLTIRLLGSGEPDEVIRITLELLREHVAASVVGFFWMTETGQLDPRMVLPERRQQPIPLSGSLTELVCREGRAIWVASGHVENASESIQHFADAICIPLIHQGVLCGTIHLYREQERFSSMEFDFSVSVANILTTAIVRARQQLSLKMDYLQLAAKSPGYDQLIGQCASMQELKAKIQRLSEAAGCVLICGESGTGKELVARAIQRGGSRAEQPFLAVNCAAIPAELIESQLFGHRAGAFTGADRDHHGFFQHADLGTLFLDEIGELPLAGQAKLLRILEGHPFLPVGGSEEISVDVRVIAATNQDLETLVEEKRFREDLYYRLGVFQIDVPPLRHRDEDIGLLIDSFLAHFCQEHGRPRLKLSPSARQKLLDYHWPGNVRQLRNVIDSAVVLANGDEITVVDLGLRDTPKRELETLNLEVWEQHLICQALQQSRGNVASAAKRLGIGRATLYRKLDAYGIAR